jgi:carboxypeptidase family protein
MRFAPAIAAAMIMAAPLSALASVFASLRGVVHDAHHRPIADAAIALSATGSSFSLRTTTDSNGEFRLDNAPIGEYRLQVTAQGFTPVEEMLTVVSGTNPVLHFPMTVAATSQTVVVKGTDDGALATDSVTPTTLVTREMIDETPGAGRTLGMQMITDYVPGAYMTHDMLHMRGGHQTSWLIDGIAIPNTKIASNVGPQIDPKDIDELETERGSYAADVGDRTYGVFNVLPRNGFERDREGEMLVTGGSFYAGETQLSLGDHSAKTAWYGSLTGARSSYGLATPVASIHHDATNSQSGFASLIRNQSANDQLRLDAQYRQDYFQIPYDPYPNDWEQASQYYESYGLRDRQGERDSFVVLNWMHTLSPKATLSVAPFYHFNQADYDSPAGDKPVATTWHQSSNYAGGQADIRADIGPNNFSGGLYSFFQRENDLFGVSAGGDVLVPNSSSATSAGLAEFHLSDHLHLGQSVALLGGMRFSIYRAGLSENAAYPRIGATVRIPRLHWVLRGFYGHFFQPAPVETVSSSFLRYVTHQPGENAFVPLRSERDEEHQFGVQIPWRGWMLDVASVKNRVNNFLDHSNVGASNIYFPIAVDGALVRAWEVSLRSPTLARMGQFHLAYSNQIAEQRGNIVGGFACSIPTDPACDLGPGYTPVDHDQRHTLNTGFNAKLPARIWLGTNVYYGSGFTNGLAGANEGPYNGAYLPVHTTFDLTGGHSFGENWKFSASVLNVTNHRVLLDNSITIGGFHFNDPRMVSGELRYRFRF